MIFPSLQNSLLEIRKDLFLVNLAPRVLSKCKFSSVTNVSPLQDKRGATIIVIQFPWRVTEHIVSVQGCQSQGEDSGWEVVCDPQVIQVYGCPQESWLFCSASHWACTQNPLATVLCPVPYISFPFFFLSCILSQLIPSLTYPLFLGMRL